MNFYVITNSPDWAAIAEDSGVNRIFVDLEKLGKVERQSKYDTLISDHKIEDISRIRSKLVFSDLIVRIDPVNPETEVQIRNVIDAGADLIMIPMFENILDVNRVSKIVSSISKRVRIVPLVETPSALSIIENISGLQNVSDLHIGLNDLAIAQNKSSIFNSFFDGTLDIAFHDSRKPVGFGGVGRMNKSLAVSPEMILAEHVFRRSNGVILSRSFLDQTKLTSKSGFEFHRSLSKIRSTLTMLYNDMSRVNELRNKLMLKLKNE